MKIYLVIPSYNEGPRLIPTVKKALKYIRPSEIVVVDDASIKPEKLPEIPGLWLLRHKINLGKGAAMKTGADFAFSQGAEAVIFMDADCQHDPNELPNFIRYLNSGYDIVFGSRRPNRNAPFVRVIGKRLAGIYIRVMFGVYISDILSGFRGMTHSAYKRIKWQSDRYGVETEMVVRMSRFKKKLKWIEIPIESIYIDKYKGVTAIDAIRLLFNSILWKFFQ